MLLCAQIPNTPIVIPIFIKYLTFHSPELYETQNPHLLRFLSFIQILLRQMMLFAERVSTARTHIEINKNVSHQCLIRNRCSMMSQNTECFVTSILRSVQAISAVAQFTPLCNNVLSLYRQTLVHHLTLLFFMIPIHLATHVTYRHAPHYRHPKQIRNLWRITFLTIKYFSITRLYC